MPDPSTPDEDIPRAVLREEEFTGQELHDTVCQTLAAASLMLSALTRRQERGQEPAREDLETIRTNVDAASEQLRLIFEGVLLERQPERLIPVLKRLAQSTALRVPCVFFNEEAVMVSQGVIAYAFYRTARIFIHLAIRGGGASRINMRLAREKKTVRLQLSFEGAPVLSPSLTSSDEKLLEKAMTSGSFQWRIEAGTKLDCGPRGKLK